MLLDKILLSPIAPDSVRRLLEQQKDGSLLYSRWNRSTQCEEIRLFNAASNSDKLIFINYTGLEIVNASLNPTADVIAFTTLSPSKASRDVVLPGLESVSSDNDSGGDDVNSVYARSDGNDTSSERSSWRVFGDSIAHCDEGSHNVEEVEPFVMIKGRYVTHLADVHPVSWMKRFDISKGMYQKVIFTDCDITKREGSTSYKENRLLLIMNRKWVGLYSILFEPEHTEGEVISDAPRKWRMLSPPKSLVLARKPLWVQWNAASQRLYVVTVSKYRRTKEDSAINYTTSLSCEQLVPSDSWSRKIFSLKIHLNLKLETLRERPSIYPLRDMDSTVASLGVNMKILELCGGGLCLAWQTLFYVDEEEKSLYKIVLIDKNILATAFSITSDLDLLNDDTKLPCMSFAACGNNVVVKGNAKFPFLHFIAVDCICFDDVSSFRQICHYMSLESRFMTLGGMNQLAFSAFVDECVQKRECDSILVFDATKRTVHSLSVDPRLAKNIYFDDTVSLANRLAVTRFGRLAFTAIKDDFRDILLHFASTDMIFDGEQFLGTLLIHYVSEELCAEFSEVPFLARLLPFGIPENEKDENFHVRCEPRFAKDDVASQISQAVDAREEVARSWSDTVTVLKCSEYQPYDLSTISDKFDVLLSTRQDDKAERESLRRRLENLYENEISGNFQTRRKSVFFAQSPEDDRLRKCIMALTYESLNKHLERFVKNDEIRKRIAVSYVITQQSAVDHYMNLFIFLNIDNGKGRSLFEPITHSEWRLLRLLRKLFDSCVTINFPFPAGIQTYLACLSFRHCVAIHMHDDKDSSVADEANHAFLSSEANSFRGIDICGLSSEFLQLIDVKCVQVTSEFVAKLLQDAPDHKAFGSLIHEVLTRSEFSSDKILDCMLQQWNHPYSKFCSARNTMKNLSRAHTTNIDDDKIRPRKGSIMPWRGPTNFEPLDVFLDEVRRKGEKFGVSVRSVEEATMQCTTAKHGVDNLQKIGH